MSKVLFIGFKKALGKKEYLPSEIFSLLRYPNSLYVQDGIFLDDDLDNETRRRLGKYAEEYVWYEVKGMIVPFDCQSKIENSMPDFYEASWQMSDWFIRFLKDKASDGVEPCLLQRWLGDSADKKIKTKVVSVDAFQAIDEELPYDVLLKIQA
ncbi:MAG: hypothetical protein IJX18_01790 [Clostridia bacterium]|nr:hypothetical protein [Clostridia bacterium]